MSDNTVTRTAGFFAYLACIPAANWMIDHVGTVQFPGGPLPFRATP